MSSPGSIPEDGLTNRAVFLSYAREDTAAAQRVGDALRSHGIEVWFDQSELRGGDAWDQKIRRQIKECAIFMPIVSERTQERGEGYFRLEWKLAVERTHLMAEGVPFLAPVVVDGTPESAALVPSEFLRVQWIRLPGSLPTPQFVEQVRRMLEPRRTSYSASPIPLAGTGQASRGGRWAFGLLALAIIAATVAVIVSRRSPEAPAAAPAGAPVEAVDPKSIAVLPFENMSEDKQNAFFTDGVQEDVLTNLSFIKDLHLVSRTSVLQYRGTTKPIKQIGRELGVAYVLEGSVRRESNKVRVTAQLIDARNDGHVWAKSYDRDLTDIFAIQGEIAQAIAEALKSVLSPETKVLLARRPTENAAAYDAYLKGRQLRASADFGSIDKATPFLEQAVRLDPNFGLAWAELGSLRALAFFKFEPGATLASAKEAIDTGVRLAPDDPGVIEALGDYYYYGYRDYTRATEQYLRLAQMRPNDPSMFYSLGLIQRRQGRMADALPNLRQGVKLDPKNFDYAMEFIGTLGAVRRYEEAETLGRVLVEAHPDNLNARSLLSGTIFTARGSTSEMEAFVRWSPPPPDHALFLYQQENLALARGDFPEAIRIDRQQRYFDEDPDNPRWNQDATIAEALAETGDMQAARTRASEALAAMKVQLGQQPGNSILWAYSALAQSLLGNRDETLRAAQKAAELMPESRDALVGPGNSATCALALTWIGEKDRALAEIERLLQVPFGLNVYMCRGSFRPLRDDPRFKALMADPKNNAPIF